MKGSIGELYRPIDAEKIAVIKGINAGKKKKKNEEEGKEESPGEIFTGVEGQEE